MTDSSALGRSGSTAIKFRNEVVTLQLAANVAAPNCYTQLIVDHLQGKDFSRQRIVDVGSGSGIVAVLASRFLNASAVWAFDIDSAAVELTRENCIRNECPLDRLLIERADIALVNPQGEFEHIIANPPQTPTPPGDDDPVCSGGRTGRVFIERLMGFAARALSHDGVLIMPVAEFVHLTAMGQLLESLNLQLEIIERRTCPVGPYTLKRRSYIEGTGYAFGETESGPTFVLQLVCVRRSNHAQD